MPPTNDVTVLGDWGMKYFVTTLREGKRGFINAWRHLCKHQNKKWNFNEIRNVGLADCNLIISDWKSSDCRSYVILFTSKANFEKIAFSTINILYFIYLFNPKPFEESGKFLHFQSKNNRGLLSIKQVSLKDDFLTYFMKEKFHSFCNFRSS